MQMPPRTARPVASVELAVVFSALTTAEVRIELDMLARLVVDKFVEADKSALDDPADLKAVNVATDCTDIILMT